MTFWYMASPYRAYPYGTGGAVGIAIANLGLLMKQCIPAFSPVVHTHFVAMQCKIDPHDMTVWGPANKCIMECAHGMIRLRAMGWLDSAGMREEHEYFVGAGKPVVDMLP